MHLYHQHMDFLLIKSPVMMCDIGMMINCNNYIADTCTYEQCYQHVSGHVS